MITTLSAYGSVPRLKRRWPGTARREPNETHRGAERVRGFAVRRRGAQNRLGRSGGSTGRPEAGGTQDHRLRWRRRLGFAFRVADAEYDVASSRMRPIYLDGVARVFPELDMIAAHIEMPWHDEAAIATRINGNVKYLIQSRNMIRMLRLR